MVTRCSAASTLLSALVFSLLRIHACRFCLGIDIDENALDICTNNTRELETDNTDLIQLDVTTINPDDERWRNMCDTVVMNPPFGVKDNKGIHPGLTFIFVFSLHHKHFAKMSASHGHLAFLQELTWFS